jgi:hypothetical protein
MIPFTSKLEGKLLQVELNIYFSEDPIWNAKATVILKNDRPTVSKREDNECDWAGTVETELWFAAQQLTLQASIIGMAGIGLLYSITSKTCKEMLYRDSVCVCVCVCKH